jgi:hypothetical protein
MPSNVFIYQLPIKAAPVNDSDLFIVEDMGTKQIPASSLRYYFYDYVVPSLSATEFFASSARFTVADITTYELSGFKSTGDLTVVGDVSATDIIYSKELDFGSLERPSLTGVKQALDSFLYLPPVVTFLKLDGSPEVIREMGDTFGPSIPITWDTNKVESQAIKNFGLTLPTGANINQYNSNFKSYTDTNSYRAIIAPGIDSTLVEAVSTWTVVATDWKNATATGTVSVRWRYPVYYGTIGDTNITNLNVIGNAEHKPLATQRLNLGDYTVTPNGEYFYIAYPTRFGVTTKLLVENQPSTGFVQTGITDFVNAFGAVSDYLVYRSTNLLYNTLKIRIFE